MPLDLNSHEIQLLFRQFEKGNVVLFAGAGFSVGAVNILGSDPPLSAQLAEILARECGWKYENEELAVVYEEARRHLGTSSLNGLLCTHYRDCKPAAWHKIIPKMFWYRIYTTNIDDVIENAYVPSGVQRLRTVTCPSPYEDHDQWYDQVQCIHLHGSVCDLSKGFAFTFEDFASETATVNPWYQAMVDDLQSKSFVFIGTRLGDPAFHHYLSLRAQRTRGTTEVRAKAFLVSPELSHIRKRQLQSQGFVVIEAAAKEFLESIIGEVRKRIPDRIALLKNRFPHQIAALSAGVLETQAELLRQFELISVAALAPPGPRERHLFFEGTEATWEDISNNLDAERSVTSEVMERLINPATGIRCFALVGHAGSGKSTTLRRTAFELTRQGHTVYFSRTPARLEKKPVRDLLEAIGDRRVFFFIDDCVNHLEPLDEIIREAPDRVNATFVFADRPHVVHPRLRRLRALHPEIIDMPYLDRGDCERIIAKLDEFGVLGALQGKPRWVQLREFLARSRKQLLVAMKEATSGRGFDAIIAHEFHSLSGEGARLAYLVACIVYMHGAPLRRRHLLACIEGTDIMKASLLANDLREVVIPWNGSEEFISPRHRVIAMQVATEASQYEMKREAVIAYMSAVSGDVTPFTISKRTPEYIGYRGIINFDNMLLLFGEDYETIAEIYAELKAYYSHDFLFWLQWGRAEVYFDRFSLGENYLNQSLGIRDAGNYQAWHYMGVLFLKRACTQETLQSAAMDVQRGEEILRKQILERGNADPYPYAALAKHKLKYLRLRNPPRKAEELEELFQIARAGWQRHPFDEAMREAFQEVYREYLMQAVRGDLHDKMLQDLKEIIDREKSTGPESASGGEKE